LFAIERFIDALDGRLGRSPLAVMLDVDGTLAPIAPTPDQAAVPPATRIVVRKLAHLPDVHVALVSGRSATDVLRMAPVEGAWIVGNHGLEIRMPKGELSAVPEARQYQGAIIKAANALGRVARETAGALLEDKRWTLSLHYRLVDDRTVPRLTTRARDVARELGLRVTEGKRVIELRPPVDVNKGTAAVSFAERVGAIPNGSVLYAGDDQTDEDAFRALRARYARAVTIRVLEATDHHPSAASDAEFALASPDELRHLLEWVSTRGTS
jgi:trehalose 6-phosphate phosphatase